MLESIFISMKTTLAILAVVGVFALLNKEKAKKLFQSATAKDLKPVFDNRRFDRASVTV